jgi:phosphoribosyl 1,2-cyclic phosphodiesterase
MFWTSQKSPFAQMDCNELHIASLNSGSNGNCYYVGNRTEAVLIDAGISCKEIEKRMLRLGLSMKKVKALFISHEHSDHIKGVCVLAKKYQLPVYITPGTLTGCRFNLEPGLVHNLESHSTHQFGSLVVKAFPKIHDACEPHSFTVSCGDTQVGVFTDLGAVCDQLREHFKDCHAAFLEANYDEHMLNNGNYPWFLRNRISGGKGHLSNREALQLFVDHKPAHMSHLLLSHLSKDNNNPELVKGMFEVHANGTQIIVASRSEESALYLISSKPRASAENPSRIQPGPPVQYSLEV